MAIDLRKFPKGAFKEPEPKNNYKPCICEEKYCLETIKHQHIIHSQKRLEAQGKQKEEESE